MYEHKILLKYKSGDTKPFIFFSENLDAIALKKLVNFVNDLMERYFSYVQRRIQLEVCSCSFM